MSASTASPSVSVSAIHVRRPAAWSQKRGTVTVTFARRRRDDEEGDQVQLAGEVLDEATGDLTYATLLVGGDEIALYAPVTGVQLPSGGSELLVRLAKASDEPWPSLARVPASESAPDFIVSCDWGRWSDDDGEDDADAYGGGGDRGPDNGPEITSLWDAPASEGEDGEGEDAWDEEDDDGENEEDEEDEEDEDDDEEEEEEADGGEKIAGGDDEDDGDEKEDEESHE